MARLLGGLGVVAVLLSSLGFAVLNARERVTLDLGFTTLYRIPLVYVGFGGLLLGMLIMLIAGIRADLKVRQILRDRLREEDLSERALIDRNQRDLFREDEE